MKKLICILLAVLLTAAAVAPTVVSAAENDDDEVYAVATTLAGSGVVLADAPQAEQIAALDSYELIVEEEPVLTVEQSDVTDPRSGADNNGYFSADFVIPETTRSVFLAGLSADKVEEIQSRIIESYVEGEDFQLTDLSFIDAEKTEKNDGDEDLCWAASSSDILTYTGWAAEAGFDTEDDVFEAFINAFTDNGGSAYYGVGWFFNGVNIFPKLNPDTASATKGTGRYFTDYAYDMLAQSDYSVSGDPVKGLDNMFRRLREGCGISLGLDIYYDSEYAGGHADTCWGYIVDAAYEPTEEAYYTGIFTTDSDSDKYGYNERRDAPNILLMANLTFNSGSDGSRFVGFDLDEHNYGVISEYTWLLPYSSDLPKETDSRASKNKTTTADLSVTSAYLGTDFDADPGFTDKIESNTEFYYSPIAMNESDITYRSLLKTNFTVTITNAEGAAVHTKSLSDRIELPTGYFTSYGNSLTVENGLPEGDYTVTMGVNNNHRVSEAYYYNNTYSFTLKVRDSYYKGDSDNDGVINVMDATRIQRALAQFYTADDKQLQRSSFVKGGLSIVDATIIQRYLVNESVPYPIGEKMLYD